VAYPPLPPVNVVATVAGAQVSFTWSLPGHSPLATAYVLEAGTGPGLANLATMALGPGTSLHIPGVPPGRYYVRLRSRNSTGTGAASNEVVVDVP
jgi:hypothetical protein